MSFWTLQAPSGVMRSSGAIFKEVIDTQRNAEPMKDTITPKIVSRNQEYWSKRKKNIIRERTINVLKGRKKLLDLETGWLHRTFPSPLLANCYRHLSVGGKIDVLIISWTVHPSSFNLSHTEVLFKRDRLFCGRGSKYLCGTKEGDFDSNMKVNFLKNIPKTPGAAWK